MLTGTPSLGCFHHDEGLTADRASTDASDSRQGQAPVAAPWLLGVRSDSGRAVAVTLLPLGSLTQTPTELATDIPAAAGRIRFFEPGRSPSHVPLGVVRPTAGRGSFSIRSTKTSPSRPGRMAATSSPA